MYCTCMHTLQTDFANRDARAAFFSRVEGGGDLVGPPRSFPGPGSVCTMYMYMYMYIFKTRHQCCMRMTCNTPTPGHPSAADNAWLAETCPAQWHIGLCDIHVYVYMYGCLQPRQL